MLAFVSDSFMFSSGRNTLQLRLAEIAKLWPVLIFINCRGGFYNNYIALVSAVIYKIQFTVPRFGHMWRLTCAQPQNMHISEKYL